MKSKEQKRYEAQERAARRAARSCEEQLTELNRRLGQGKGAGDERFRLVLNDARQVAIKAARGAK